MTDLFSDVAHQMPIQLVEPIERMINRDIRYRLSVQQFMMVSHAHCYLLPHSLLSLVLSKRLVTFHNAKRIVATRICVCVCLCVCVCVCVYLSSTIARISM